MFVNQITKSKLAAEYRFVLLWLSIQLYTTVTLVGSAFITCSNI